MDAREFLRTIGRQNVTLTNLFQIQTGFHGNRQSFKPNTI
jgi:hypothetical protein